MLTHNKLKVKYNLSLSVNRHVKYSAALQSTVLSRILLARDYADMKSRTGHIT